MKQIFIQSIIIIDSFAFLIILLVFLADHDAELRNSGSSPSLACAAKESKAYYDEQIKGFDDINDAVYDGETTDKEEGMLYTGDEGCQQFS